MSSHVFSLEKASELLYKLVEIPSPSGKEERISRLVYDYVEGLGFRAEFHEVYKGGYNVVVRLGRGDRVMLCGHLDTVLPFDMKDPFKPVIREGRLYGRGACDMKAGVTAMLMVLEDLASAKSEPNATFAFVVDEELYGRGAAELMIRDVEAETCVITEPTSLKICVGNAGCVEFKLKAYGRSGHGAHRGGVNAIHVLYSAYREVERRIVENLTVEDKYPMKPVITLGKLTGGYGPWVVPWEAEAEILFHMHPRISYSEAVKVLEESVKDAERKLGARLELELVHGCDGFLLEGLEDAKRLAEAHREIFGEAAEFSIIESETDANALYHKLGMPCVIYGPGDVAFAHSSEENVALEDVVKAARVLRRFLEKL